MRRSLHAQFGMDGGLTSAELKDLDRKRANSALRHIPASASPSRSRTSLPSTPGVESAFQSRQGSSERTSEIAPEIVVWTEDMDFDDMSEGKSGDSSSMDVDDE